jgi:hypothetical protein
VEEGKKEEKRKTGEKIRFVCYVSKRKKREKTGEKNKIRVLCFEKNSNVLIAF